uniref:Macrophage-expressed gene 1 protein n=1 Tax=Podarcis muralis TaxID=64176 RepID=A0A670HQR7_PODMU|nr:macrophage-expressed gene 1 protein [Podarcis muralis]
MSTWTGIVLSLTLITWVCRAQESPSCHPSVTGFQACKQVLNLPALEVLPGGGWDNLRNLDMARVISLNYSSCSTTEDGAYFIPNGFFAIARKQSSLEMNSEIIESWMDYQCATSVSINAEVSFLSINGKFSTDFRRMKTHQVRDQAVTTRVQVRNLMYTVKFNPGAMLDEGFQRQLVTIASYLENNHTRMADYLAEILVLNYGTHVITGVDAGASLIQEDQVKSSFVKDGRSSRISVTAAAGASFRKMLHFDISTSVATENAFTQQYQDNLTSSRVESIGGVPFYPGITLKTWQESTTNQLVAVDRSGLPLPFFITPGNLPGLPTPTVKRLSRTVASAISRYYTFNTYPGCIDPASPNFNFYANMDDGSCEGTMTNFTFGGVYQECAQLEGPDAAALCQDLEQRNPLTGDFSCPEGYDAIKLRSQLLEEGYSHLECRQDCKLWVFCRQVCSDVFTPSMVQFSSYWCAARNSVPQQSGFLFGGLFSAQSPNPMTNSQSCPSNYYQLKLLDQLVICVSNDARAQRNAIPFGGFFSCQVGNPLTGHHRGTDDDPYSKRCPAGFGQHLALISDGCEVQYCVQAGRFTEGALPQARLPPFTRKPVMSLIATNTVLVMNSHGDQVWIKDTQTQMWKIGSPADLHNMNAAGGSFSGGETAGVTVGATTGLAILIGLSVYGCRRYKKREYKNIGEEERSLTSSNNACDFMGEIEVEQEQERQTV